jgi:ferredoxin
MKQISTITIIQQRDKCIGCNYCVEFAPLRWAMSRADGKSILIGGIAKKGFWKVKTSVAEKEVNIKAAAACPVKVIQVIG